MWCARCFGCSWFQRWHQPPRRNLSRRPFPSFPRRGWYTSSPQNSCFRRGYDCPSSWPLDLPADSPPRSRRCRSRRAARRSPCGRSAASAFGRFHALRGNSTVAGCPGGITPAARDRWAGRPRWRSIGRAFPSQPFNRCHACPRSSLVCLSSRRAREGVRCSCARPGRLRLVITALLSLTVVVGALQTDSSK